MTPLSRSACAAAVLLGLLACGDDTPPAPPGVAPNDWPFTATPVADLDQPWAMTFLPDGRLLVTEKPGRLHVLDPATGDTRPVFGVPEVAFGGQGGLGDVVLHPDFVTNRRVYLSYAEEGEGGRRGAAVAHFELRLDDADGHRLEAMTVVWRQSPKVTGSGHYGHRIAFGPGGDMFISSGDRQKLDPAQDMAGNLGKIVRLADDGTPRADNPFFEQGGVTAEVWSLGHRNPLGLAFDPEGRLWNTEMGPRHGDELNRVVPEANYGWPVVSNGDHYSGEQIPDHDTRPDFDAPQAYWVPAISPGNLAFYSGQRFSDWQGDALIGGLSSKALVRVVIDGDTAAEVERFDMGARIREVESGPDGAVWLLEDDARGSDGRLLKLEPR